MVQFLPTPGAVANGAIPFSFPKTSSESIDSFAQQLAAALQQVLGQSGFGSQIEIGIKPAPNSSSNTGLGEYTLTVQRAPVPSDTTATANVAPLAVANTRPAGPVPAFANPSTAPPQPLNAVTEQSTGAAASSAAALAAKYPFPMIDMFENSTIITGELPSTPIEPPKPRPVTPEFYKAPAPEYVTTPEGVKLFTLESYMQRQLELLERGGATEMIRGTPGWSAPEQLESFYLQAKTLAVDSTYKDPRLSPPNWLDVVGQYRNTFLDWLSHADSSYFDAKLSGPVYDASTRTIQTSNGPVTLSDTDLSGIPAELSFT